MIINPVGFGDDFQAWADQMAFLVQAEVPQFLIYNPAIGDTWEDWAMCLVGAQDTLGQDSPNPYEFDTWQEWAMRLFDTQDFVG